MGKSRKNAVTDEQILSAYAELKSTYKVAATLGVGDTTVLRVLVQNGVDRVGLKHYREGAIRFSMQQSEEIRRAYEEGAVIGALCERFDGKPYAIRAAIHRAGGKLRTNPAPTIKPGELDLIRRLHDEGLGQVQISVLMGRSQSFVSRAMRQNGIRPLTNGGAGRYQTADGYFRVRLPPDDPMAGMANNGGYVLEHRLVMARKLGRTLSPTETVHHIDNDRGNNDPANLQLRHGKHGKHSAMVCLDCGSHNVGPAPLG